MGTVHEEHYALMTIALLVLLGVKNNFFFFQFKAFVK
jgi:hypothetical protein